MIDLIRTEQFEDLWNGKGPNKFIILFSAAWCVPCKSMDKNLLDETAKQARLPIYYSDFVLNEEIATRCDIKTFPTFVVFKPGAIVARHTGADTIRAVLFIKRNKA